MIRHENHNNGVEPSFHFQIIGSLGIIYIDSDIQQPWAYTRLAMELDALPEVVTHIQVQVNSDGGEVDGSVRIRNLLRKLKIPVDIVVSSGAHSAASLIALSGTSLTLEEGAYLMFHNFQDLSLSGVGREFVDRVKDYERYSNKMDKLTYAPFLTEEEIEKIANNGTVLVHWDDKDLPARMKRHFGIRRK